MPVFVVPFPRGHWRHSNWAICSEYESWAHSLHSTCPFKLLALPGMHGRHDA